MAGLYPEKTTAEQQHKASEALLSAKEQFSLNTVVALSLQQNKLQYDSAAHPPNSSTKLNTPEPMTVERVLKYRESGEGWGGGQYKTYEHYPGEKLYCAFATNGRMAQGKICVVTNQSYQGDRLVVVEATNEESNEYKAAQQAQANAIIGKGLSSPFSILPNIALGAVETISGKQLWSGKELSSSERVVTGGLTAIGALAVYVPFSKYGNHHLRMTPVQLPQRPARYQAGGLGFKLELVPPNYVSQGKNSLQLVKNMDGLHEVKFNATPLKDTAV